MFDWCAAFPRPLEMMQGIDGSFRGSGPSSAITEANGTAGAVPQPHDLQCAAARRAAETAWKYRRASTTPPSPANSACRSAFVLWRTDSRSSRCRRRSQPSKAFAVKEAVRLPFGPWTVTPARGQAMIREGVRARAMTKTRARSGPIA